MDKLLDRRDINGNRVEIYGKYVDGEYVATVYINGVDRHTHHGNRHAVFAYLRLHYGL